MAIRPRQLGPVTRIGAATVVLGVVCYVVGWRLGWIELMVATAGCLVALAVAVPFVIGPVALQLTRTVEPDRVMVGEPAGAVLSAVNPGRRRTRAIGIDEVIGGTVVPVAVPGLPPGGDHTTVYRLPTDRRAKVQVGPAEVARTDPLGLLRRQVSQAPATTLWVHPRWALVGAPSVGVRQGPRRSDERRLAGRRRRVPRVAPVPARRRPAAHPLDVDGPHGHAHGASLRRQPAADSRRPARRLDRAVRRRRCSRSPSRSPRRSSCRHCCTNSR